MKEEHRRSVSACGLAAWGHHMARDQGLISQGSGIPGSQVAPQLAETVLSAPNPFVQVIVDIKSTSIATDRVALLGDGAFSARPHAAAGTAKAAEDGWKLVEALQAHYSIANALTAWDQSQLQLGQALVDRCRQVGERSQFLNTWTAGDPTLAFGLYGAGD